MPSPSPSASAPAAPPVPSSRVRARPKQASSRLEQLLALIDATGLVVGALVPAMALLEPMGERARLPLVLVALAALCARVALAPRDASDVHPLLLLAAERRSRRRGVLGRGGARRARRVDRRARRVCRALRASRWRCS